MESLSSWPLALTIIFFLCPHLAWLALGGSLGEAPHFREPLSYMWGQCSSGPWSLPGQGLLFSPPLPAPSLRPTCQPWVLTRPFPCLPLSLCSSDIPLPARACGRPFPGSQPCQGQGECSRVFLGQVLAVPRWGEPSETQVPCTVGLAQRQLPSVWPWLCTQRLGEGVEQGLACQSSLNFILGGGCRGGGRQQRVSSRGGPGRIPMFRAPWAALRLSNT